MHSSYQTQLDTMPPTSAQCCHCVPNIFNIISKSLYKHAIPTISPYTTSIMSQLAWAKPVYHLILSDNSSGYEQTFCEKNLQLTELKLYINNIARCLDIVVLLSARIQDHQFNITKQCSTFLQFDYLQITIEFNNNLIFYQFQSKIHLSIQQTSDLLSISE